MYTHHEKHLTYCTDSLCTFRDQNTYSREKLLKISATSAIFQFCICEYRLPLLPVPTFDCVRDSNDLSYRLHFHLLGGGRKVIGEQAEILSIHFLFNTLFESIIGTATNVINDTPKWRSLHYEVCRLWCLSPFYVC